MAIWWLVRPILKKDLYIRYYGPIRLPPSICSQLRGYCQPLKYLTTERCPGNIPWTDTERSEFDRNNGGLCQCTELQTHHYRPNVGLLCCELMLERAAAIDIVLSQLTVPDTTADEVHVKGYNEQSILAKRSGYTTIKWEAYDVIASLEWFHNLIYWSTNVMFSDRNIRRRIQSLSRSVGITWLSEWSYRAAQNGSDRSVCSVRSRQWRDWPGRRLAAILTNHVTDRAWAVVSALWCI